MNLKLKSIPIRLVFILLLPLYALAQTPFPIPGIGVGTSSGGGTAAYSQAFTSQTSVTLTHSLGTLAVIVSCYDNASPPNAIGYNSLKLTDTNNATVTFNSSQSGSCVVTSGGGAQGPTGATGATSPPSGAAGGALAGTYPNPTLATGTSVPINPLQQGVTCDGSTDDTSAWNTLFAAIASGSITQKTVIIPSPCQSKVTSTINIGLISQLRLIALGESRGAQSPTTGGSSFLWYGAAGGTVMSIKTQDSLFQGFTIATDAGPNQADVGIAIDQDMSPSQITTDNTFQRVTVYEKVNRSTFKGVTISATSTSNVENMKFYDLVVVCGSTGKPAAGGIGIQIGASSNAKTEQFYHAQITYCTNAMNQINGSFQAENWQDQSNTIEFKLANWSEAQTIKGLNSEGGGQLLVTTGHAVDPPLTVEGATMEAALAAGVPSVDASQTYNLIFIGNKIYGAGDTVFANTDGDNANLNAQDNHYTGSQVCTMAQYNSFHLGFHVSNDKWEGGNTDCPGSIIPLMVSSSTENGGSGRSSSHAVDFRSAGYTSPFQSGTSLPATCTAGVDWFNKTNGSAGQTLYYCSATNTWTLSGLTITGLTCSAPQVLTAISAGGVGTCSTVPIPQGSHSAAYTTVLTDAGVQLLHPTADNNPRTFTIDSNANVAYPLGTVLTFVNQINTLTISITSDTMYLGGTSTTGSRTLAAHGIATATKTGTTEWVISGPGLT